MVPTGSLYAVPWGVLPSLHGRPVVTAPSATAWLAATSAEKPKTDRVLLVRGPGLGLVDGEMDKLATHHDKATVLSGDDRDRRRGARAPRRRRPGARRRAR